MNQIKNYDDIRKTLELVQKVMKTNEKLQKKNDKLKKKADKADEIIQKVKGLKNSFQTETDDLSKVEQNCSKKRKIHKNEEDILFFKNLQKEFY